MMQRRLSAAALAGPVALLALTGTAPAHQGLKATYSGLYYAVQQHYGSRAPGRNIRRYGLRTSSGARRATSTDLARSIHTLRRMLHPPTVAPSIAQTQSASVPAVATTSPASDSTAPAPLSAIARCESGGNPRAISPGGTYRGKYQFDYGTWRSVGGSGDPAAASEAEQDRRAAKLYAQRGSAPWPVCGKS